jgi:glycosyltransferase involved in cell wall biosynthesis
MEAASHSEPVGFILEQAGFPADGTTVAVVITTFNQARFLGEAIKSVLAQTRQADRIIVVDDGSSDDPASVVAQFQKVQLIRQVNRGPSAARNVGLRCCTTSHIVFLDADDRLLPTALHKGLVCITGRPDCAFVYGGYHVISESGHRVGPDRLWPIEGDAHLALLRKNLLGPSAVVLYRCDCLLAVNGYDETLRRAEDYDLYLRIAQRYPIASHPEVIVEYRRHGQNITNNHFQQLRAVLRVLDLHQDRIAFNSATRAALKEGRASRRNYYVSRMLEQASVRWRARHDIGVLVRDLTQAAWWSPFITMRALFGALSHRASKGLTRPIAQWARRLRGGSCHGVGTQTRHGR